MILPPGPLSALKHFGWTSVICSTHGVTWSSSFFILHHHWNIFTVCLFLNPWWHLPVSYTYNCSLYFSLWLSFPDVLSASERSLMISFTSLRDGSTASMTSRCCLPPAVASVVSWWVSLYLLIFIGLNEEKENEDQGQEEEQLEEW